jgi:hypothetical protein
MSTVLKIFLPRLGGLVMVALLCSLVLGGLPLAGKADSISTFILLDAIGNWTTQRRVIISKLCRISISRWNRKITLALAYSNRCLTEIYLQDYLHAWQDCTLLFTTAIR